MTTISTDTQEEKRLGIKSVVCTERGHHHRGYVDDRPQFSLRVLSWGDPFSVAVLESGGQKFEVAREGDRLVIATWGGGTPPTEMAVVYDRPTFGGRRAYVECPGCHRRCTAVFLVDQEWRCRACHRLQYRTSRFTPIRRAAKKILKIRAQLGDVGPLWAPFPERPKGMKWAKYMALLNRLAEATIAHTELMKEKRAARTSRGALGR